MIVDLYIRYSFIKKKKATKKPFLSVSSVKRTFNFEEYNFSQSTLEQVREEETATWFVRNKQTPTALRLCVLQVFMEFAREQENEEVEVGTLSTTFQWRRLRQDGPVSVNHGDSIVHQL